MYCYVTCTKMIILDGIEVTAMRRSRAEARPGIIGCQVLPRTAQLFRRPLPVIFGQALTTGADEDEIRRDCHLSNDRGENPNTGMRGVGVTFGNPITQVNLYGLGQNPVIIQSVREWTYGNLLSGPHCEGKWDQSV
jgi:hypothetical protein